MAGVMVVYVVSSPGGDAEIGRIGLWIIQRLKASALILSKYTKVRSMGIKVWRTKRTGFWIPLLYHVSSHDEIYYCGAYGLFVGAVVLSLARRENGCKPFCNAACAELGLFRISIASPRRCAVVSTAA